MNKKFDIGKILTKGSAKQRALLYFNNIGEKNRVAIDPDGYPIRSGKGFLTESEEKQLHDSFKTSAEIQLYNNFLRLNRYIYTKESTLFAMMFQYRETIASLSGYCLLYHGYTEFADNLSGLYFSLETPEEKKKVLKYLEKHNSYLWAKIGPAADPDKNGMRVLPGWEDPKKPRKNPEVPKIRDVLNVLSKRAERQLQECKTMLKVIRDIMEDAGFKTEEHTEELYKIEQDLKQDKAPLPKFSKKQTKEHLLTADDPKARRRLEEIFGKNWLFPSYEDVEIDEKFYKIGRGIYLEEKGLAK